MQITVFFLLLYLSVFSSDDFARAENDAQIINGKIEYGFPSNFPKPIMNPHFKRAKRTVDVWIEVNENGEVVSAKTSDVHPSLIDLATRTARNSSFEPTKISGKPVKATGLISYQFFDDIESVSASVYLCAETEKCEADKIKERKAGIMYKIILAEIVINDRAKNLTKPKLPNFKNLAKDEIVTVRVLVDVLSGKVTSAKIVSGIAVLHQTALDAAMKTKFSPTNINISHLVFYSGLIVYKFSRNQNRKAANH